MTSPNLTPPEVLRCGGTADFLAALPQLAGFTATNSLFLVLFEGRRAARAMRIDLPPDENPTSGAALVEFVCDTLLALGCSGDPARAPAIAVMSAASFAECQGIPWRRFVHRLERRLRRVGISVRESCCRAPDGWASYSDPAPPVSGRPLSEIDLSMIARAGRAAGRAPVPLDRLGDLPEAAPARISAVARALTEIPRWQTPAGEAGPTPGVGFAWLEETAEVCRALNCPAGRLSPRMTARVLRAVEHPNRWLVLLFGLMTRPEFPCELARELSPLTLAALPITSAGAEARPAGPGRTAPHGSMYEFLSEISPVFDEPQRLRPVRELLPRVAAEAPRKLRPGALALSAGIWWLCGSQTVAAKHLDLALEINPAHELSHMLRELTRMPAGLPVLR